MERDRLIVRTNGGINPICAFQGRPLNLFVNTGQIRDYIDERALLSSLPEVDWFRVA